MTRERRLEAFACAAGHVALHAHETCPECGRRVHARAIPPAATLVLDTTVRVNPGGSPFVLGIAATRAGRARSLCRVEVGIRGHGYDRVVLQRVGEVLVARASVRRRKRRLRGRSPVRLPSVRGWRRS